MVIPQTRDTFDINDQAFGQKTVKVKVWTLIVTRLLTQWDAASGNTYRA